MIRLTNDQYIHAVGNIARGILAADQMGMKTELAHACMALELLGTDFDIDAIDAGPDREDIRSGNVWTDDDDAARREVVREAGRLGFGPFVA